MSETEQANKHACMRVIVVEDGTKLLGPDKQSCQTNARLAAQEGNTHLVPNKRAKACIIAHMHTSSELQSWAVAQSPSHMSVKEYDTFFLVPIVQTCSD